MQKAIVKISFLMIVVLQLACGQSSLDVYNDQVEKELTSNKKVNDIFMGISFGMTSKEFYMHCWDMNKKGLFTDGANNTAIKYDLKNNELKHPAEMNFYPEFKSGRVSNMWVKFQYTGWVPWNKKLDSDDLLPDVLQLYKKWYPAGNPFLEITDKEKGTIYVKVDGNRRIIIGRFDDVEVKVDYTDLSLEKK
jgi:hypothetical protein